MELYRSQGIYPYACDLRDSHALKKLTPVIREVCREKIERDRRKGIMNRPIRAMAAGIPNVGKSTFINSFSGSSSLKTGNKPGVTKGKQWIRISKEVELMDTPGLLWPKFEDQSVGLKIALIGSMPDTILNTEELSLELIRVLAERYEGALAARYGIDESGFAGNEPLAGTDVRDGGDACDGSDVRDGGDACDGGDVHGSNRNQMAAIGVLTEIAKNRGCLKKGGEPDTEKAALLLLDDFRSGRLGRMSLESPEEMAK
jgi:ribosome biogenesis GTPase A